MTQVERETLTEQLLAARVFAVSAFFVLVCLGYRALMLKVISEARWHSILMAAGLFLLGECVRLRRLWVGHCPYCEKPVRRAHPAAEFVCSHCDHLVLALSNESSFEWRKSVTPKSAPLLLRCFYKIYALLFHPLFMMRSSMAMALTLMIPILGMYLGLRE